MRPNGAATSPPTIPAAIIQKATVASSPNGNGINIWWMGCPRALALLSMFLLLLLPCQTTARVCPRVDVNLKEPSRRLGAPVPLRTVRLNVQGKSSGLKILPPPRAVKGFPCKSRPPESCYTRPRSYSIQTDEG